MPSTRTLRGAQPLTADTRITATVLLAADGAAQSDGAVRVALAQSRDLGARLEILAIVAVEPMVAPEIPYGLWSEGNLLRRTALREAVEQQLERVTGQPREHTVLVLEGNPAYTIARIAVERRAALIVVGLGRHRVVDRLFSDETAIQLARISRVPVLAVPGTTRIAPRHAVVAVDFSDLSLRAAQAAIEAVSDTGRVDLVHVMPLIQEDAFAIEGEEPYQRWAKEQLGALAGRLAIPSGVTVTIVTLRGRPAPELLAYVTRVGADLVTTGTHGRGFVARALLGSVTSQLLRAATCSLLAVPRDPLPALMNSTVPYSTVPLRAESEWASLLTSFTSRNLGRRTILEVDDLEIGAQAQEYNYPLIAAMYDARDRRLQIMVGDRSATGRHLSRSIGGVAGVDVLTDGQGHDVALRVEHGTSHTLLTFAA
jgi:nucleotide-binding universal stress UspA family protein